MGPGQQDEEPSEGDESSFTGDVAELSGEEAFGVGIQAAVEMIKDKLKDIVGDLDEPYAVEMETDERPEHPGQTCEEAHPGAPHMRDEY